MIRIKIKTSELEIEFEKEQFSNHMTFSGSTYDKDYEFTKSFLIDCIKEVSLKTEEIIKLKQIN